MMHQQQQQQQQQQQRRRRRASSPASPRGGSSTGRRSGSGSGSGSESGSSGDGGRGRERRAEHEGQAPPPQQQSSSPEDAVTLYVPNTPEWERVACLLPVRRSWARANGAEQQPPPEAPGGASGGKRSGGGGRVVARRVLPTSVVPAAVASCSWRAVNVPLPPLEARWRRPRRGPGAGGWEADLPPLWVWPAGGGGGAGDADGDKGLFGAVPVPGAGAHALLPSSSSSSSPPHSSSAALPSARWRAARLVQTPLVVVADLDALVGGPVAAAAAAQAAAGAEEDGAAAAATGMTSGSSRRRRPAAGRNERALARLRDALALASLPAPAPAAAADGPPPLLGPSALPAPAPPAAAALVVATPRRWPAWQRLWAERRGHLPPPDAVVAASCTEVYVRLPQAAAASGGGGGGGGPRGAGEEEEEQEAGGVRWGLDKHWRALLRDEARRSGWSRARAERVARALMARYGGGSSDEAAAAAALAGGGGGESTWLPALPPPPPPSTGGDGDGSNGGPLARRDARMGPPDRQSPVRVQMLVRKRLLAPFLRDLGAALDQLAAEAATAAAAALAGDAAAAAAAAAAAEPAAPFFAAAPPPNPPAPHILGPWAAVHVHAERGWAAVDLVPGAAALPRALRHLRAAGRLGAAWPSGRLQRERERRALARELRRSLLQPPLELPPAAAVDGGDDGDEDDVDQDGGRPQQLEQRAHHPRPAHHHDPPPPAAQPRPRVVSVRLPPEGPRGAGSALPARWAGTAGLGARSAEEEAAAPLVPGADLAVVVGRGSSSSSEGGGGHAGQQRRSPPPPPPFAAGLLAALEDAGLI
jgi:hypothetical protein